MVTKAIAGSARAAMNFIIAAFIVYLFLIGSIIYQGFNDAVGRGDASATAAAKAVKINTKWIVEVATQALRRMDAALGENIKSNNNNTLNTIRDALEGLPASAKAYIVAADGQTLYNTDPNFVDIDIRDREYFSVPAEGKKFFISPLLVSRLDGNQIFTFSQRLERDDVFVGVAIISFDGSLLGELLDSMSLGAGSTLAILRSDGMLVARYPPTEGSLDLSDYLLFTELLPNAESGTYFGKSPLDGLQRIVGYQTIPEAELIALASVGSSETIGRFWRRVKISLVIIIPTVVALALCAAWIIQLLKRDVFRHDKLQAALATNTALFREIHHRVKNNMQSMQSLVSMQNLPEAIKTNFQLRLAAMSAVHEHMYNHDSYATLDAPTFIASITEPIFQAYGSPAQLILDIDQLPISHEQATPLAMLLNEVITNSLKYAALDRTDAKITVSLKRTMEDEAKLVIADDGLGFDPSRCNSGTGTKIIKGMVMQLDGSHTYKFDGGTTFSINFPIG